MTSEIETIQDVLRAMRAWDSMGEQWADRIERALKEMLTMPPSAEYTDAKKLWGYERALAGSEPVAEMVIDKYGCTLIGLQARGNLPDGKYSLYTTPHPAIGNKPAVDDAMVERGSAALAKSMKFKWPDDYVDEERETIRAGVRAALTAALIDSAQDGKGE